MVNPVEQLERTLIYEVDATSEQIQEHVQQFREFDKAAEKKQTICVIAGVVGVLSTMGSSLFLVFSDFKSPVIPMIVGGTGVVTAIVSIAMWFACRRFNLSDRRYELLRQVVQLLGRDSAANATFRIRLDFNRPDAKPKFIRAGKVSHWDVKFYEDPWLTLQGRFLDGTAYVLDMTELTQHRSRWARSRSGKQKHKSKTKSATVTTLRMKPKAKRYPDLESFAPTAAKAVQVPNWCEVKKVAVVADAIALKVGAKTEWGVAATGKKPPPRDGVKMVALMFLSCYQILNLARQIGKSGGASS